MRKYGIPFHQRCWALLGSGATTPAPLLEKEGDTDVSVQRLIEHYVRINDQRGIA